MENDTAITQYNMNDIEQVKLFANNLADYIKQNALSVKIKGSDYVKCEGWQYAGNCLGIMPLITELKDKAENSDTVYKYRATAILQRRKDGEIVGRGIAICSNKEPNKKTFEEYAIASMAQTRAIGKAYRNLLAWIVKLAGYAETPAEEMEEQTVQDDFAMEEIIGDIEKCKTVEELKVLYTKHKDLRINPAFMQSLKETRLKIENDGETTETAEHQQEPAQ